MDKRAPSYVCERPQRHSANLKPLGCTLGQWNRRNLSSGRGNRGDAGGRGLELPPPRPKGGRNPYGPLFVTQLDEFCGREVDEVKGGEGCDRCVACIRPRSDADREELWAGVVSALEFFVAVLVHLPPRRFALCRKRRKPIVLYTDAMYQWRDGVEVSVIGLVWFDPELEVAPCATCPAGVSGWKHAFSTRWARCLRSCCARVGRQRDQDHAGGSGGAGGGAVDRPRSLPRQGGGALH